MVSFVWDSNASRCLVKCSLQWQQFLLSISRVNRWRDAETWWRNLWEWGMCGWRVTMWSSSTLASGQYSPKSHWETKKRKFLERGNPGVAQSRLSALLETTFGVFTQGNNYVFFMCLFMVLAMKPGRSHLLGRCCLIELHPQPCYC